MFNKDKISKEQEHHTKGVVKGVVPRIHNELKFTQNVMKQLNTEIDRMTEQNKLLYDEVKLTNEKLQKIESYITEKTKS